MARRKSKRMEGKKKDNSILFAWLGAFLTVIGFLIVYLARRKDDYAMYYAKQGIVLFIGQVIVTVVSATPLLGWLLSPVLWIFWFVLWIFAWVNALSGEKKKTWLVQEVVDRLKI